MLEFGKSTRPRDLFPVLVEDATSIIEEDSFAFALAAVLDRGTKSEIIWTIPYYLKRELGHLDPSFFMNQSLDNLERILRKLPVKPRYITAAPRTMKELSTLVLKEYDGKTSKIWENRKVTLT